MPRLSRAVVFCVVALCFASIADGGVGTDIDPLENPSGYVQAGQLSASIDVSGEWVVAGAPQANTGAGRTFVWQRSSSLSSAWSSAVELTTDGMSSNAQFGTSVSIDGDWIAVGAPDYDEPGIGRTGAVVLYQRQSDSTWLESTTLQPTLAALHTGDFGDAVALHLPYLIVGVPAQDFPGGFTGGCAMLYELEEGAWNLSAYIMPPWDLSAGARYGHAVGITDGLIAVGAPYDESFAGDPLAGSVFTLDEAGWFVDVAQGYGGDSMLGYAIDADGGLFAAGEPGVSLIRLHDQLGEIEILEAGVTSMGTSVAVSATDGEPLHVAGGAPWDGTITAGGHVRVWSYDSDIGAWSEQYMQVMDATPVAFGSSVALHRGTIAAGDAYAGDNSQGTAFVRNLGMTSWVGASGGFWTIATNWSAGVPVYPNAALLSPTGDDVVEINVDDDPHFAALLAGSGHPWLRMAAHSMILDVSGNDALVVGAPDGSTAARLTVDSGFIDAMGSVVIGEGNAPATLFMEAAEISVTHDLMLRDSGTLAMELDELTLIGVAGTASFNGAIVLTPPTDFAPGEGASIWLLSASAISGDFRSAVVPSVADNRVVLDYSSGTDLYANVEAFDQAVIPEPGGGDDTGVPFNDIHAADLTGNGRDELILSIPNFSGGPGILRIVEFDDTGAVTTTTDIATGGAEPNAIDSGDIAADGFVDLLITEGAETVAIFPNVDGNLGNLQYTTVDLWVGAQLTDIVVVDWDGSSTLQPLGGPGAIGISSTGSAKAFRNNGGGSLSPRPSIPIGEDPDDGDPANTEEPKKGFRGVEDAQETIVTLRGSREIIVLGSSDGLTLEVQQRHAVGSAPSGLTVADFNNDTWDDVLVTGDTGEPLSLLLGTASAGLSDAMALPAIAGALDAVALDANNDGWIDVAVVVDDGIETGIGLLRNDSAANDGNLVFTWRTPSELGLEGITKIAAGDLDGDGVDDLIAGGDLERGGRLLGGCPTGEIPDCNGNCAPESWLGDDLCDDGAYEYNGVFIFFNCELYNCDEGDCVGCDDTSTGSCCFDSGSCQDQYGETDCVNSGGTWAGAGTWCDDINCSDVGGACCVSGMCSEVDSSADCSGDYYEGERCGLLTCTGSGTGVVSVMFDPSVDPPGDCSGDFNDDGTVDVNDLLMLIGNWGGSGTGDMNDDGIVDVTDLLMFLDVYGPCD